jgi:large subunit ribosomal protein L25
VAKELKINATARTEFGKGAARRTRRAGLVPAVIYGHGQDPRHISINGHELMKALKQSNVLLEIQINDETELALPKSVVRDPIKGFLEHVDLIAVRRGEKVVVEVPVHPEGKVDPDGILETVSTTIEIRAEATAIPNSLVVNVEGFASGESKYARDVILPAGTELVSDPDMLILHLAHKATSDAAEISTAGVAEVAAPAEAEPVTPEA